MTLGHVNVQPRLTKPLAEPVRWTVILVLENQESRCIHDFEATQRLASPRFLTVVIRSSRCGLAPSHDGKHAGALEVGDLLAVLVPLGLLVAQEEVEDMLTQSLRDEL